MQEAHFVSSCTYRKPRLTMLRMIKLIVLLINLCLVCSLSPFGMPKISGRSLVGKKSEPVKPPLTPVETLIGSADKKEGGFFDPLKLSAGKDIVTLNWYRAAELKHGRVAMLAALGTVVQGLNTGIIPGFPVSDTNAFTALENVYKENPFALLQIGLAIAAVEVLCASIESKGDRRPGDFGWDPANIRPKSEELLNEMQTKELKNGRLAMLSVAGMAYQTYLTGQGTIEQIASGHLSPFGDGQGIF